MNKYTDNKEMKIQNIIFDWSGTLSDDLTPVHKASVIMFNKLGREEISLNEFKREFTLPYMIFWNKYFPNLTIQEEEALFIEAINQVEEPTIYEGVKAALEYLNSIGINMIVVSSHPQDKLIKEAAAYGVECYFKELNGSIQDKTEIILDILRRNDFEGRNTVYVGDMTHDIEAGKKANVITVGISWGYNNAELLQESSPDYIVSDMSALTKLIGEI